MATISVVIPCFNAASYIGEALESVRAQQLESHRIAEVIVIDDGSTDGSGDAARSTDGAVTLLTQSNAGISAARNSGIAAATSDWIAFLDADDLWPAHSLQSRATLLASRSDLAMVSGAISQFVSPDVPAEERDGIRLPVGAMSGRLAGALLVRREVFDVVGLFSPEYSLGETIDWVSRVESAGLRIGAVDTVVLRRRVHRNNSVQKTEQLKSDYLSVLRASIKRRRDSASAVQQDQT